MISAEPRGGNKPSLNEALGWIGSRVDDIYGAGVGRLDDVWIDPATGAPRWLLVKEGRFGGRTTLIPFEDAAGGVGSVWIPYERDVVRDAPAVAPGQPLTRQVEDSLRAHYEFRNPRGPRSASADRGEPQPQRYSRPPTPPPAASQLPPPPGPPTFNSPYPPPPSWPAPPAAPPQQPPAAYAPPPVPVPAVQQGWPQPVAQPQAQAPTRPSGQAHAEPGHQEPDSRPAPRVAAVPPPVPAPGEGEQAVALPLIHELDRPYEVEVVLSGEITFRGNLAGFRLVPRGPQAVEGNDGAHSGEPGEQQHG